MRRIGKAEEIDWSKVAVGAVQNDGLLFSMLASASFLEITAPVFTENLVIYCQDNQEVVDWLVQRWLPEELEHGNALKAYVKCVWPSFEWERSYAAFYNEYKAYAVLERLQPSRALEMLARCVTETGSATAYKCLRDSTSEPVLKGLMDCMHRDEARHYSYFLKFFRQYAAREKPGKSEILRTILSRKAMVNEEDTYIAYKHVFLGTHGEDIFRPRYHSDFMAQVHSRYHQEYSYEQAVKMLLQPLGLGGSAREKIILFLLPLAVQFSRRP
jgi:hypothetical protein